MDRSARGPLGSALYSDSRGKTKTKDLQPGRPGSRVVACTEINALLVRPMRFLKIPALPRLLAPRHASRSAALVSPPPTVTTPSPVTTPPESPQGVPTLRGARYGRNDTAPSPHLGTRPLDMLSSSELGKRSCPPLSPPLDPCQRVDARKCPTRVLPIPLR